MKKQNLTGSSLLCSNVLIFLSLAALLALSLTGCNLLSQNSESLQKTETALSKQQTRLAQSIEENLQATIDAQQATIDAASIPQIPPTATPDLAATQVAQAVQETMAAQQSGGNQPLLPTEGPAPTQPGAPPTPSSGGETDFNTRMKSASILLFEDIVHEPAFTRYVKKTLDMMGLNYKDDGSAVGWLKSDLLGGAPNGQPWDLVILAVESRTTVQGEFFEYLGDVLNQGTAVILEAWHLDAISRGAVSPILARCGVQVYPYFPKTGQLTDIIVWPLTIHPILSEPNSGMRYTKVLTTWMPSGDLGSLMALTGSGDAQFLLGVKAEDKNRDGTLAVCLGGQLILQTFSSHSFNQDTMMLLWQNYIVNALKYRLGP